MYKAGDIDLPKSQYETLRHIEAHGGKGERGYSPVYQTETYDALYKRGFIGYYVHEGEVDEAWLEQPGLDWISGYEARIQSDKEKRRRERRTQFVNLGGGAILGGVVSIITTLVLHYFFGL